MVFYIGSLPAVFSEWNKEEEGCKELFRSAKVLDCKVSAK